MRPLLFAALSLLFALPAFAWDETEVPNLQRSRTRIAEIVLSTNQVEGLQIRAHVRLEDDTAQLCTGDPRHDPRELAGRPLRSYVYVGVSDGGLTANGSLLSVLLTARASGSELTVVVDTRLCQVVQVSL